MHNGFAMSQPTISQSIVVPVPGPITQEQLDEAQAIMNAGLADTRQRVVDYLSAICGGAIVTPRQKCPGCPD